VDSLYAHYAWLEAIERHFDVQVRFPVIEDPSMTVGRGYGMLAADARDSAAIRATYVIDPDGVIRAIVTYPMSVGRSVDEILRLVCALQRVAGGDALTPEGWQPGSDVLLPAQSAREHAPAQAQPWFHTLVPDRGAEV
jgi:peroxiredoxin (alkyl hydroperoxide reductase subunit C)